MSVTMSSSELFGREAEQATLDALVAEVRSGSSQVLVVTGEAGVGKTALLEYLRSRAIGCTVCFWAGVESETELPYAGVREVCSPFLDCLDRLPVPQQNALKAAIGLRSETSADRFFIGLAVLHLLAEASEDRPVVCIIDDAQWLDRDSMEVLVFVARRILAEKLAFVFAVRDSIPDELRDLTGLSVDALSDEAARQLLRSSTRVPIDPQMGDRIIAEARGNPLALLELPLYDTVADWAGYGRQASDIAGRIDQDVAHRFRSLDPQVRSLLLLAASEPLGDPSILWRAADRLGIGRAVAACAVDTGLIEVGAQIKFRHPLVRSAIYRSAAPDELRAAHRCLADVTDLVSDPDRRAWHQSLAVLGPDEDVARALEAGADRAHARGGLAAEAAFLQRATELTPNRAVRSERALAAASAKRDAGLLDEAESILCLVDSCLADPIRSARAQRLHGQIAFDRGQAAEASTLLRRAANEFEGVDADLARDAHLEALAAAMWVSGSRITTVVEEAARAVCTAAARLGPPRTADLMLDALATRITDGYVAASAAMAGALDAARDTQVGDDVGRLLLIVGNWASAVIGTEVWDFDAGHALAIRNVRLARERGALVQLQYAVNLLAHHEVLAGRLDHAAVLIEEDQRIAGITGNPPFAFSEIMLAAFRGDEAAVQRLIPPWHHGRRQSGLSGFSAYAKAVLDNGHGRYDEACAGAGAVFDSDPLGYSTLCVGELAEAASRVGDERQLTATARWLAERATATQTPWACGINARVLALAASGDEADALYRSSIDALAPTRLRVELARSRLLYGEWLRREGRCLDARKELTVAFDEFRTMGMAGFEERARRELTVAGGVAPCANSTVAMQDLTAHEAQIAELARQGFSNAEIGTRLFLSPRTVEWHLGKVFGKLGITSRRQLRDFDTSGDTFSRHA